MSQNHQHYQQNQYYSTSKPHESHRPPPGNAQGQRREFLWRERVRLELQVQALLVKALPGSGKTCSRGKRPWGTSSRDWPAR
jgi:hypothetical protein